MLRDVLTDVTADDEPDVDMLPYELSIDDEVVCSVIVPDEEPPNEGVVY